MLTKKDFDIKEELFLGARREEDQEFRELRRQELVLRNMNKSGDELGFVLLKLGAVCERRHYFKEALKWYQELLELELESDLIKYYALNNYAFCLIYFERFSEAEGYLYQAIELSSDAYNAWKNIGVCFEHEGFLQDAFDCYYLAVRLSFREWRSVEHLRRLIARNPELKNGLTDYYRRYLATLGIES